MNSPRTYATAGAFRATLEERLRHVAKVEQVDVSRLRRQVSFDRLLARLFQDEAAPWALKGGYALELRIKTARATVDMDLALQSDVLAHTNEAEANQSVHEMVEKAASVALGDWFVYRIGAAVKDLEAAPYGGARYPVEARMDARVFARFHLDVGIGDAVMRPLETVEGRGWLQFAGITAPPFRTIPQEQQFAEKLHAYTLPRRTPNSRTKDLIDLLLLTQSGKLQKKRIAQAVRVTFERRRTHAIPSVLSAPPAAWSKEFRELATECRIVENMQDAFAKVEAFLTLIASDWQK